MTDARAVAASAADRVIDEDAAIALASLPDDVLSAILDALRTAAALVSDGTDTTYRARVLYGTAAARDGVSDDEALAFAQEARQAAVEAWIGSRSGRAAVLAAIRHAERTRKVIGRGISPRTVPTLERVTRAAVARRLAERDSPRAAGDDEGPPGSSGPDARKARGGT